MFRYLAFLLTTCFCYSSPDAGLEVIVLENQTVTLSCPHAVASEAVRWSRYRNGLREELLTIKDGKDDGPDKRYSSLADNKSLVITRVKKPDAGFYLCNEKKAEYLTVTTDPKLVGRSTPRNDGSRSAQGPNLKGPDPVEDEDEPEGQQYSDVWKVPVGVVIGAALVLLGILTLRFCSKKRAVENTDVDKTVAEVIYEEIEDSEVRLRREPGVESPYYWTDVTETLGTSTPPNDQPYAKLNKLKTKGRGNVECVYYLAQNPPMT
ncbi:uncharacterized protein LOC144543563 [Centroberyx gerrardi]